MLSWSQHEKSFITSAMQSDQTFCWVLYGYKGTKASSRGQGMYRLVLVFAGHVSCYSSNTEMRG